MSNEEHLDPHLNIKTYSFVLSVLQETSHQHSKQKAKLGKHRKTPPTHLIVPANDELQVTHKLPEGFVV